ncbi:MAG: PH domain-containing protein [Phycisphaerales bacterium]
MSAYADRLSSGLYRQLWRVITPWLRVPDQPPDLPHASTDDEAAVAETFKPDQGFLRYLKFWFWIVAIIIDVLILGGWIALCVNQLFIGLAVLPLVLVLMLLPDIIAFIAIHLRYDTTWYAITDRSLRIRRGIWVIRETTVTFENVQNVAVQQGPIERIFDIASVTIETAGAGGTSPSGVSNAARMEGLRDATRVRDLILKRLRATGSAGLGDEEAAPSGAARPPLLGLEHIVELRAIRDHLADLAMPRTDDPG